MTIISCLHYVLLLVILDEVRYIRISHSDVDALLNSAKACRITQSDFVQPEKHQNVNNQASLRLAVAASSGWPNTHSEAVNGSVLRLLSLLGGRG